MEDDDGELDDGVLDLAAQCNVNPELMKLLLERGGDPNKPANVSFAIYQLCKTYRCAKSN